MNLILASDYLARNDERFPMIKGHVLLPLAGALREADARMDARLDAAEIERIVSLVPDSWLAEDGREPTPRRVRGELVRREALAALNPAPAGGTTRALVFDPAASYPWSSDDPPLSASGIMGDPRGASAAHGEILIARVVEGAGAVMRRLKHNATTKGRG